MVPPSETAVDCCKARVKYPLFYEMDWNIFLLLLLLPLLVSGSGERGHYSSFSLLLCVLSNSEQKFKHTHTQMHREKHSETTRIIITITTTHNLLLLNLCEFFLEKGRRTKKGMEGDKSNFFSQKSQTKRLNSLLKQLSPFFLTISEQWKPERERDSVRDKPINDREKNLVIVVASFGGTLIKSLGFGVVFEGSPSE